MLSMLITICRNTSDLLYAYKNHFSIYSKPYLLTFQTWYSFLSSSFFSFCFSFPFPFLLSVPLLPSTVFFFPFTFYETAFHHQLLSSNKYQDLQMNNFSFQSPKSPNP